MKYCCSRKRPDHMIKSKAPVSPSRRHGSSFYFSGVWCFFSDVLDAFLPSSSGL